MGFQTNSANPVDVAMPFSQKVVLNEAMELLFESSKDTAAMKDDGVWEHSPEMEDLVSRIQGVLEGTPSTCTDTTNTSSPAPPEALTSTALEQLDNCFQACNEKSIRDERESEFLFTEEFIQKEQELSRERQRSARALEASEEKRLATEVAVLKGLRFKSLRQNFDDDLRTKIANAEKSYTSRKMVYAKASQVAAAELRLQFARVRSFLEQVLQKRHDALYLQHRRSLNFQTLRHALNKTDPRLVSLDKQIARRFFQKQKADLNEFHMKRMLEESVFLENMMDTLERVQKCKENAAADVFNLNVKHLKKQKENQVKRNEEFELLEAAGIVEMAKLVAQYTEDDALDKIEEARVEQNVDAIERGKEFDADSAKYASTTKLYDTILWNVASNDLGLTSTSGSSLYSSDFGSELGDIDDGGRGLHRVDEKDDNENKKRAPKQDGGDAEVEYPEEPADDEPMHDAPHHDAKSNCLTPVGTIHSRQLARQLRKKEKALNAKHKKETRQEKLAYQSEAKTLKAKHQDILDKIIAESIAKKDALREEIDERLDALAKAQEEATAQMRQTDYELMRKALMEEDQRVEEAESNSFRKAQELISAQVFHEVRNALSSVIAMSEMTTSLKNDSTLSPRELVGSVDDMLDQIGDVVNYAVKMLNEILDVSKINSGAFTAKKDAFDLQDIMLRATRMQQAKASKIRLNYKPLEKPCIAVSDSGIVERLVATMISNSVKFTPAGAVQPFICPLEAIQGGSATAPQDSLRRFSQTKYRRVHSGHKRRLTMDPETSMFDVASQSSGHTSERSSVAAVSSMENSENCDAEMSDDTEALLVENTRMKLYAVGVADTGNGLTEEKLDSAKNMISTSTSKTSSHGAQNTGFGLYHAHLQTKALGSQLSLARLEDCSTFLNDDMRGAVMLRTPHQHYGEKTDNPGPGTVLYFTIPVYEDYDGAESALKTKRRNTREAQRIANLTDYSFRPQPSPCSSNNCFRVLVADDVLMLRKGVVHTIGKLWTQKYPHCPVSVSTACTAEDMLRAVEVDAYDLVISDHHFNHDESKIKSVDATMQKRPSIMFDERNSKNMADSRTNVRDFFANECFTTTSGDGNLLGMDALTQLATSKTGRFPTPLLMLVSGHKIQVDECMGIIVAQKPLKSHEFVTTLEKSVGMLLASRRCEKRVDTATGRTLLYGGQGSQLFVHTNPFGNSGTGTNGS